jgi:FKBP-type peptidyl-prolyl cis-trans isomerase SlyD
MQVAEKKYVSIDYKLTVDGEVVDESEPGTPLGFVSGVGQIVPGLDNALQGKRAGDEIDVSFSAEDGYGAVQGNLFQELPKENFPEGLALEVGMIFQAETPHGMMSFKISDVKDDAVVADLNHPLAGKDLNFAVKIVEVRDATQDEIAPSHDDDEHVCHGCGKH